MREVVRYSEAFKLRLVEDIAAGKYKSFDEARRRNGIRGDSTLRTWIKQYGREDTLPKRVMVETMNEIDELKAARSRIRDLEAALADAHKDYCLKSAFLDIARKRMGVSAEELKKERYDACLGAKDKGDSMRVPMSVGQLCRKLGMSRQNYYKSRQERQRHEVDSGLIDQLVLAERAIQPRLGGRKLFHILRPKLAQGGIKIGRDRFFEVLQEKSLVLYRLPGMPKTTDSRHSLPVFHNLVKGMEAASANQVWVGDITYIRTEEGFLYLSLLMDLWSRKIVGYNARDTLETEGALRALKMALKKLPKGALAALGLPFSSSLLVSVKPAFKSSFRWYGTSFLSFRGVGGGWPCQTRLRRSGCR